jgi:hypothetical protein
VFTAFNPYIRPVLYDSPPVGSGVGISVLIPDRIDWIVISASVNLVTSGAVADRYPIISFFHPSGFAITKSTTSLPIVASLTIDIYHAANVESLLAPTNGIAILPGPFPLHLIGGSSISFTVLNMDANDGAAHFQIYYYPILTEEA